MTRPIQRLRVFQGIRQVEASEVCRWRYAVTLALVPAGAWLLHQLRLPGNQAPTLVMLFLLLLVGVLAIAKPWHRRLHVDMDTGTLTGQWRLLGILPFRGVTHDLEGRQLGVGRRTFSWNESEDGQTALGCLAVILPFPFSLLVARPAKKVSRTGLCSILAVFESETGQRDELAVLEQPEVVAEFLTAVREILPDHVRSE